MFLGTGKTTGARIYASKLYELGLIPTSKFIETSSKDFMGDHVGAAEKLTSKKFDEARGGVLFIDEAYSLMNNSFGTSAIDSIVLLMCKDEHKDGKTVVVLGGYLDDINSLFQRNTGLKRRFPTQVEFRSLGMEESFNILEEEIKKGNLSFPDRDKCFNYFKDTLKEIIKSYYWGNIHSIQMVLLL
jgi:AAA+ superfamily predicted ATPase